ncbi:hypothetical protein, partial [Asaia sp. SF2.1]|uniref:hypothetical protein n=1 Tax=Asaia sp. SF2.1 TaxID=406101 RepID=UPI001F33A6B8
AVQSHVDEGCCLTHLALLPFLAAPHQTDRFGIVDQLDPCVSPRCHRDDVTCRNENLDGQLEIPATMTISEAFSDETISFLVTFMNAHERFGEILR